MRGCTEKFEAKRCSMYKNQARSTLQTTVPKPFRFRTKERSDLRASNAEKRLKQVEERVESQVIERLPSSNEGVGSHLEKESGASFSMDVIPSATRIWVNPLFASKQEETIMPGIPELEFKVQTLQTELTTLSTHLTLLERDRTCMVAEINELKLRLQSMEQQVHWLESVTGQAMPYNHNSTLLCSDNNTNRCCQPVASAANPFSAATLIRSDSQHRTSIDPLNFMSLESFGGISLTEDGPEDFEFIMDSAINCSFDGSHVPEAWNCVSPTGISIDGGPNRTPASSDEGTGLSPVTLASSSKGLRNSSPMSFDVDAKSAVAAKDDSMLKSGGPTPLPSYLNSMETSDEGRSLVLAERIERIESRQQEDLGYWEEWCIIDRDRLDQCCKTTDRFDPFDELSGSYLINEPSNESKESRQQEAGIVYWKKLYMYPLDEPADINESVDEGNESRQEDLACWEKPCTMDQFVEATLKNNPFWEKRIIEAFLAKPGLPDYVAALCQHMLNRIDSNSSFTDPLRLFNEEEAALFDVVVDDYLYDYLNSLPSYLFSVS